MKLILQCDAKEMINLVKAIQSQPGISISDIFKYLNFSLEKEKINGNEDSDSE